MRDLVERVVSHGAADRAVAFVERSVPHSADVVTILTYHRLDLGPGPLYPGLASVTPAEFEAQIEALAERRRLITADELLAAPRRRLRPGSVLVTFDDGYRDFGEVAWPVLRRHGAPAVLFVPTDYPGRADLGFWWDELYGALEWAGAGRRAELGYAGTALDAFKTLRGPLKAAPHDEAMARVEAIVAGLGGPPPGCRNTVLDWGELAGLAGQGLVIAPHSRSHPLLERVPSTQLDDEVAGSYADLRDRFGHVAPLFAYPSGSHNQMVRDAVARAGFAMAVTTGRGVASISRDDPLRLSRLNVGRRSSSALISAQMLAGEWSHALSQLVRKVQRLS